MSSDPSASTPPGDARLAGVLFVIFLGMTVVAIAYPSPARTLPLLVGSFGAVLSGVQLVRSLVGLRRSGHAVQLPARAHAVMFVWFIAAVGLVVLLGILAGSAVFVSAFLWMHEREPLSLALPASVALALALYLTLERGFGLVLFEGVLWP
jgi:hypothetical protein